MPFLSCHLPSFLSSLSLCVYTIFLSLSTHVLGGGAARLLSTHVLHGGGVGGRVWAFERRANPKRHERPHRTFRMADGFGVEGIAFRRETGIPFYPCLSKECLLFEYER